jgi:hypothetical protein
LWEFGVHGDVCFGQDLEGDGARVPAALCALDITEQGNVYSSTGPAGPLSVWRVDAVKVVAD